MHGSPARPPDGIAEGRTGRTWNRDTSAVIGWCSNGTLKICMTHALGRVAGA